MIIIFLLQNWNSIYSLAKIYNRFYPFISGDIPICFFKSFHLYIIKYNNRKYVTIKQTIMHTIRNRVQLLGRLGADPETKTLEGGKKLVTFSVATNETYTNAAGEKVEETQWHQVATWGKVAERAEQQVKKGTEVMIEGKIVYRSYTDKEGTKRYATEVHVHELMILEKKIQD
jgi:single-strand DNA-binding protein